MKLHSDTIPFFKELSQNNNSEWFQANRSRWDTIRHDFTLFTQALIDEMLPLDPSLGNITAKNCIYRINRDLRFSHDKRPYKTHIACFLPTGGNRKCAVPGYYIQIGQDEFGENVSDENPTYGCSLGGGIFRPTPSDLEAIRQEIYYCADEFKAIMAEDSFKQYFGNRFWTLHKLSRPPKGYPADWADIDLLKYKDYTTMHDLSVEYVASDELLERTLAVFRASVPLNKFIQRALYKEE